MNLLVTIPQGPIRDSFLPPALVQRLEALGSVTWNPLTRNWTREELATQIADIDIVLSGWGTPRLDESVLARANTLKLLAHTGGATADYTSEALYDRGIAVISGNELYARSVAESVIAYALYLLRDIEHFHRDLREKGWAEPGWSNQGLLDRKVGLIGFGAVARYTAELLRAFNAELLICSEHLTHEEAATYGARKASLDDILSTCDILSLHLAKTPKTFHLLSRDKLRLIRPGAIFINTARGSVVDEAALAEELATGRFRAALDVFETEPLPLESPLRDLPNVLLMPHMGGPTLDRRPIVTEALLREIPRKLEGLPSPLDISRDMNRRMTQE